MVLFCLGKAVANTILCFVFSVVVTGCACGCVSKHVCMHICICLYGLAFCQPGPLTDHFFTFSFHVFHYYFIWSNWKGMVKFRVIFRVYASALLFIFLTSSLCMRQRQTESIRKAIHRSLLNIDIVWILYAFIGGDWVNRHWKREIKKKEEETGTRKTSGGVLYMCVLRVQCTVLKSNKSMCSI